MHSSKTAILLVCVIALAGLIAPTLALAARDLGRESLAANDGWASFSTGTTGGVLATANQVYTVHNRKELIAALNDGAYPPPSTPSNKPKIIYIDGTIDANVTDDNQPLTCRDYYRNGYTLEAFLAAFDPAIWGRKAPTGTLETARTASQQAQQERVRVRVGSNTTIVGTGKRAVVRGAWLDLRGTASAPTDNVIIRNITFQDTYDCFPEWSPTDGTLGAWNALYDSISLRNTEHVWVDHNTFEDRETLDSRQPSYFGVLYQIHDGELDITNASDLVTVSWNRFLNHDKVMLIGSSDTATADRGKLRVTIHHNLFDQAGQRTPRVRFGQVHVYNNYYRIVNNPAYVYTWGAGIESAIYAENNYFEIDQSLAPGKLIASYSGTRLYETGTRIQGTSGEGLPIDVLSAYNAANDPDLATTVGWKPTLVTPIQDAQQAKDAIAADAGPGNW
jgi:pectate lyase